MAMNVDIKISDSEIGRDCLTFFWSSRIRSDVIRAIINSKRNAESAAFRS